MSVAINIHQPHLPPAPQLPPAEIPQQQTCCQKTKSCMWRGLVVVGNFLYEIAAKVALFVLLGVAAQLIFPVIAPPFFAIAASLTLSRLVIKILDRYDLAAINTFKEKTRNFVQRFWYLQIIVFIFAVAISLLHPIPGIIVGSLLGGLNGVIIGAETVKVQREIKNKELSNPVTIQKNRVLNI
jgi:hypothetical protein